MKTYLGWLFKPAELLVPSRGMLYGARIIRVPGWETLELVSDRETLERVNRATGRSYFGGSGNEFLSPLFGEESVFTLDGDRHRLARRLIAGSLTQRRVEQLMPQLDLMVGSELDKVAQHGRAINVGGLARRMTMRMTCLAILDSNEPKSAETLLPAFESVTGFLTNIVSYRKSFYKAAPFPLNHIVDSRINRVRTQIAALIAQQRAIGIDGPSVMEALLRAQSEEGYDDAFIRDNIISTISAGYDTTGSALSWTLFWLSQDGAFDRLRARIDQHGKSDAIAQFVSEALRYCPPLEILPRRPADNADVTPGVTMVCPCPFQVHHDPDIFEEPQSFLPERFAGRKYLATEYFPFGAASRLCLGINIAPQFLQLVVSHLLERNHYFRFRVRRFSPVRRNVSLWPSVRMRADWVAALPQQR